MLTPVARCIAPDYFGFGRSRQAGRRAMVLVRHAHGVARALRRRARPAQRDGRRCRTGAACSGCGSPSAARPGRAARRDEHRHLLGPAAVGHVAALPRTRPPHRHRVRAGQLDPAGRARTSCRTTSSPRTTRPSRRRSRRPACSCSPSRCRPSRNIRPREDARGARKLERWDHPALVFFGDSDPIFSPRVAERIAELIPGAELQEPIAGAGHFLQEDAGEEVGQRIAAWLKSTSV